MRVTASQNKLIEIDHSYALSLLGVIGKSLSSDESPDHATVRTEASSILSFVEGQVEDFTQLRQTLEKQYLCTLYKHCQGNLEAMGTALFGDGSKTTQHKIMIRMNQLGISLRALRK